MKRCTDCAERVRDNARKCRHCGYVFTAKELSVSANAQTIAILVKGGLAIALTVMVYQCSMADYSSRHAASVALDSAGTGAIAPTLPKFRIRIERFASEGYGDNYCEASAKVRNIGSVAIPYLRLTQQFSIKGKLVATEWSFADNKAIEPGATSTWDDMYRCPGRRARAEVTATAASGDAVEVEFAKK